MFCRLPNIAAACAFGVLLALGACAPTTQRPTVDSAASNAEAKLQRGMAFDNFRAQNLRLNAVSYRILTAGAEFCGTKTRYALGLTFDHIDRFTGPMRQAAAENGIGGSIRISGLAPGGAAHAAGLEIGDIVTDINTLRIPYGKDGLAATVKAFQENGAAPLALRVIRNTEPVEIVVQPVRACDYPVVYQSNPQLNAYADGSKIVMFSGMVRFAGTDEELALIVAHELAHNMRGHLDAKKGNAILGAVLDGLLQGLTGVSTGGAFSSAAANANSPDFEAEADYVGLYVMARAGYTIDNAPHFWRRMAVESPGGISHTSTHPATNDRFVALQAAIAEIDAKRTAGLPLVPNEKKTTEPPK
jgi:beta-barrel assembly-enhancing protease